MGPGGGARRLRGLWPVAGEPVVDRLPSWVLRVAGLLLLLVGAALALRPFRSMAALLVLVVLALLLSGVGDAVRGARPWGPLRGGVQVLAALALLVRPGAGLALITIVVGAVLVVDGLLELAEARQASGVERWAVALTGVASTVVGVLALLWQDVAALVVAVAFGVRLALMGVRLLRGGRGHGAREGEAAGRPDRRRRLLGPAAAAAGALTLAAVGVVVQAGHPRPDAFYDTPSAVPDEPGRLLSAEPFTTRVPEGATGWRILYTTTRRDGIPAVASALVVTPDGATGPTPVLAWAHGTTGWARGCAPSLLDEPFEAGALSVLDEVLAQGWTVVATDYVGLGTDGPHPYVIGEGEGRSVLDSLRAARELDEVLLEDRTVVWGHSQGGHAALWTGALASSYAPELRIDGVAALAPASDLQALVRVVETSRVGALFAVYVVSAYAAEYDDVQLTDYVRPGARVLVREMAQRCLSERGVLVSLGQSLLLDGPLWQQDPTTGPFGRRLAQNVPTGPIAAPLLVAQGEEDTLITPQTQRDYVLGRCAAGQQVDHRTYADRDHLSLVAAGSPAMDELLTWTQERLRGEPAVDTCPG